MYFVFEILLNNMKYKKNALLLTRADFNRGNNFIRLLELVAETAEYVVQAYGSCSAPILSTVEHRWLAIHFPTLSATLVCAESIL